MDIATAAYIAGIMDGEGCFRIDRFPTARSPIGFQYRSIAEVTMCDKDPIDFMAKATDRNYWERKLPSGRIAYVLTWRNSSAAKLIRSILPYMIGKREQAALCLHFEDHVTPGRGRTYKPEDKARCEEIREKVSFLKRNGYSSLLIAQS